MTISTAVPNLRPGEHIKRKVLPEGLSVKKAAELMGVGRPALSNLLNGNSTTPWVPRGESGWEFGCDRNAAQKAEHDYAARTGSVPPEERKTITFVFVTPRNWPGKDEWAKAKRETGAWKDVRAYDASDL